MKQAPKKIATLPEAKKEITKLKADLSKTVKQYYNYIETCKKHWQDMINDKDQEQEIEEKDLHHDCQTCLSPLTIMEDGFPTCTNSQCGIIYKNVLDFSPEWRFFGGNDKHAVDQTRCGNPINPLLKESSFGCKILCDHRSSYEMKRIRKWTEWQSTPHKEKSL